MGKKYFTVSYDDGTVFDEQIIQLMEKHKIRGTFNLNSGLMGSTQKLYLIPGTDIAVAAKDKQKNHIIESVRLTKEKAEEIYARDFVEVASHGTKHLDESKLTKEELAAEVRDDINSLSEMFGYPVRGHIFPFGQYNDDVLYAMKEGGICYGRKVSMMAKPKDFLFHAEYGIIKPTCWHLDSFAKDLLQKFIDMPCTETDPDQVFYMWGHGYELSFGTKRGNIAYLESLFEMVSKADDVICVTNAELIDVLNFHISNRKIDGGKRIGIRRQYKNHVLPIWGKDTPYNTGELKKDLLDIRKKPLPMVAMDWIRDVFGTQIAKDSSGLDTFSYITWIAKGNESIFMDDIPNIKPFICKGSDTAVIIAPGGAFCNKSFDGEGDKIARFLNSKGISAFVLDYRLNPYEAPAGYLDMQRAIRFVRHYADHFGINKNKIGAMGFSAGGYIAGAAAILLQNQPVDWEGYVPDKVDMENGMPNFLGMLYPVTGFNKNPSMLSMLAGDDFFDEEKRPGLAQKYDLAVHLDENCPPQFLCYGTKDSLKDMLDYSDALFEKGLPVKTLILPGAGHGFALGNKKYAYWADEFADWIHEVTD